MRKLFVAAVDDATREQRDAFTTYLQRQKGLAFWHHIQTIWLIVDESGVSTADSIRKQVRKRMPGAIVLVIQIKSLDFSGHAPVESHQWLRDVLTSGE